MDSRCNQEVHTDESARDSALGEGSCPSTWTAAARAGHWKSVVAAGLRQEGTGVRGAHQVQVLPSLGPRGSLRLRVRKWWQGQRGDMKPQDSTHVAFLQGPLGSLQSGREPARRRDCRWGTGLTVLPFHTV